MRIQLRKDIRSIAIHIKTRDTLGTVFIPMCVYSAHGCINIG